LSLAYGWTPREIGALSLCDLAMYLEPLCDASPRWLDANDAREQRRERLARRAAWVGEMKEIIEYGLSTS